MDIPAGYDHQWISLQDMTTNEYPCWISPPIDIPAGYDHQWISLLDMTTNGYPCWIWPPMDIPAGYDHQWISLQDMTTNGYPCRIWPPMDIPAGYDHHLGYQKWIVNIRGSAFCKIKWRLIIDLEIRNTKVQISDFLKILFIYLLRNLSKCC